MVYFLGLLVLMLFVNIMGGSKIVKAYNYIESSHLLVFMGILLIIGCRSMYVGTDTATYVYEFLGHQNGALDLIELITTKPEPLYTLLLIFCKSISENYTVFLMVAAIPISLGFSVYVKNYSDDYMMSFILFVLLGVLGFCMAGLRQSIALGISLFAYRFARERRLIPFLICCLVAFGFHNSSLVFFVVYPLIYIKKIDLKWWVFILIAFILGMTRNGIVMRVASMFFTQDRYNMYGITYTSSLNYTMLIIQVGLLFFCYLYREQILAEDERNSILYLMAFIGTVFQCFTPILGEFFRISLYFSISLCVLVPKTIYLIMDSRIKELAYFGINGIGIYYVLLASSSIARTYAPFWSVGP